LLSTLSPVVAAASPLFACLPAEEPEHDHPSAAVLPVGLPALGALQVPFRCPPDAVTDGAAGLFGAPLRPSQRLGGPLTADFLLDLPVQLGEDPADHRPRLGMPEAAEQLLGLAGHRPVLPGSPQGQGDSGHLPAVPFRCVGHQLVERGPADVLVAVAEHLADQVTAPAS
jgi:hypothetical protein